MGRNGTGVKAASETSIEIAFIYRGKRCRERIKLSPSPANLKRAAQHRASILDSIQKGTFEYRVTFPDSPRVAEFADKPGEIRLIEEYLEEWLEVKKAEVKASTYVGYKDTVRTHLIPKVGKIMLADLKRSHIVEMCGAMTVSPKTIRNRLSVLRSALSDAVQDDLIHISPMYGWEWRAPKQPKKKEHVDPFTADEQKAILGKLTGQECNLFQFMFWTGLRTSELVGLDWGDVDWKREEIHVRRALTTAAIRAGENEEGTKTIAGDRRIKILAPAMAALLDQKQYTYMANESIFHHPSTGARWRGTNPIWKLWKKTLQLAKVKHRNPYQTRHTYASMMLTAGESDRWVANQMGHTDVSMINRVYGKWIIDARPDAGNKAVALFAPTKEEEKAA